MEETLVLHMEFRISADEFTINSSCTAQQFSEQIEGGEEERGLAYKISAEDGVCE